MIDSATRLPLPNAEVSAESRRGLTDAAGEVRILWPENRQLRVRIRQLGFRYVDRTFTRDAASRTEEDTAVVALSRTAWALPQVAVRAERRCRDPGDPRHVALSQASMELLRFGAEQFENFRRAYPFDLSMERRTFAQARPGGTPPRALVETDTTPSLEWGDRYVPGNVVQRRSATHYFVPLLFVSALADSAFWDRHCFHARGVVSHEGRRPIRLDGPRRFEGYTIFSTPTPYIAMPDSTMAWWMTGGAGGMQTLVIRELRYRESPPPAAR